MEASVELARIKLQYWLNGIELPSLHDPRRSLEERSFKALRHFLIALLASCPDVPDIPPSDYLAQLSPELSGLNDYRQHLALPFHGPPSLLIQSLGLDDFESPLSSYEETLIDGLTDQGRLIAISLGGLF